MSHVTSVTRMRQGVWRMNMREMTNSGVCQDLFTCVSWQESHLTYVTLDSTCIRVTYVKLTPLKLRKLTPLKLRTGVNLTYVTSHTWLMSHASGRVWGRSQHTHTNQSWCTHDLVNTHTWMIHTWPSQFTDMKERYRTFEAEVSICHLWGRSRLVHANKSWCTHKLVNSHTWMSHVTRMRQKSTCTCK